MILSNIMKLKNTPEVQKYSKLKSEQENICEHKVLVNGMCIKCKGDKSAGDSLKLFYVEKNFKIDLDVILIESQSLGEKEFIIKALQHEFKVIRGNSEFELDLKVINRKSLN